MKKMCALNEDLFRKSNLDIPEGPVKVDGATNPVYTDALNQHAKRKKDIEKIMKDADKVDELEKPFTGSTDKKNMPKKVEEPKMKLDESLFEEAGEEKTPAKSKRGKRSAEDVYTQIYNELCGDIKGVEAKNRRFKVSNKERYSSDDLAYGDGDWDIVVYSDKKEALDFAKKVAKEYGVEISDIKEYTSRYAKHKFSVQIHTDKPIVNEGLTKAQRYNRNMDRIFQDKRDRDTRMSKFLKDNSNITDDELKKVQDGDKVGLELKNRGLHDRYWNEVEGKNESLKESYTKVDTIECGEDTYRVVGGGFNPTADALVTVEDEHGERTRIHIGDVIEFYTWYDRNGNVVHEPDMDESLKSKKLTESSAHSDVARHFNYRIPADALDVLTDLLERVRDSMDEEHEIDEAVQIAIDEGLIYNSDIWAIKALYEEARLNDETYEELFNDLYSIASNVEDVDESLKRKSKLREDFYRGNRDIEFVWHGEWSDPELIYKGYSFNYWDIEDALWYDFLEETGYKDSQSEDPEVEREFDRYVQSRASDYLDDCIYGGAGTPIEG